MTAWRDGGAPVEAAVMGEQVLRALRVFELRYRGACRHPERGQWALGGDLRSCCTECARASASFTAWESTGPCSLCGALLTSPPARVWTVRSTSTGVSLAFRMCPRCAGTQLGALSPDDEGMSDGDE